MRVLIAEGQKVMRRLIVSCLEDKGFSVSKAASIEDLEKMLVPEIELLILDAGLVEGKLSALLERLKDNYPTLPVIVMSYKDIINESMEALQRGAVDYLIKPFSVEMLETAIEKAVGEQADSSTDTWEDGRTFIRLDSLPSTRRHPAMKRSLAFMSNIADSDVTVLIGGESGVGKEIFARTLHLYSQRRYNNFVGINCASLPSSLLEGELFGSERGAFTGSMSRRIGKFELAQKGTLLLDEISEMDISLQAKLLRVIQEKELYRIGGDQRVRLDVRIIATTNRDLRQWVRDGKFREDLYYRLNVIALNVPPLQERIEDIPILAQHVIDRFNSEHNRSLSLTMDAVEQLCRYNWPGNIREMENVLLRTALLTTGNSIKEIQFDNHPGPVIESPPLEGVHAPSTLPPNKKTDGTEERVPANIEELCQNGGAGGGLVTLEEMERRMIKQALAKFTGNRTHAANSLGISVRTLRNKLRSYPELDPTFKQ